MKLTREEESNGGLASCPLDQQVTHTDTDNQGTMMVQIYRTNPDMTDKQNVLLERYSTSLKQQIGDSEEHSKKLQTDNLRHLECINVLQKQCLALISFPHNQDQECGEGEQGGSN